MSIFLTLYNNGNELLVLDKGDYAKLISHNNINVNGCRFWYRNGIRFKGRLYKQVNI